MSLCPESVGSGLRDVGTHLFGSYKMSGSVGPHSVVEVTDANYAQELPRVLAAIRGADFVAVDGEFTGLFAGWETRPRRLDSVSRRYGRQVGSARSFGVVQFGVATFAWDGEGKTFQVDAWAFYTFPRTGSGGSADALIQVQAESINFLGSHGFDFNKAFASGIGYLTPAQEAKARKKADRAVERDPIVLNKPETVAKVAELMAAIEAWAQADEGEAEADGHDVAMFDTLPLSGFLRRVVHEQVAAKFGDALRTESVHVEGEPDWKKFVRVLRTSPEEKAAAAAARAAEREAEIHAAVGFRHVLDAISDSRAPLIAHNGSYDMIYTLSQFYGRLPGSVQEYKSVLSAKFPAIYDTKLIAESAPRIKPLVTSTALEALADQLDDLCKQSTQAPAFVPGPRASTMPAPEGSLPSYHDAGYDALVTGMAFARITSILEEDDNQDSDSGFAGLMAGVADFKGKINLGRCIVPYLDLNGPFEPVPDNVFKLAGFSSSTKTKHIRAAVSPHSISAFQWENDSSILVAITPAKGSSLMDAVRHLYTAPSVPFTVVEHVNLGQSQDFVSIFNPSSSSSSSSRKRKREGEGEGEGEGGRDAKVSKPLSSTSSSSSSSSSSGCAVM